MKKITLFFAMIALIASVAVAQKGVVSFGKMPTPSTKTLTSTITTPSAVYVAGTTYDLTVDYNHATSDDEWVDGISLTFPSGITVNSATDAGGAAWNSEAGDGVETTWGDMAGGSGGGPVSASVQWTVNITIDAGFTGDLTVAYSVVGDGYGAEPHSVAGDFILTEAAGDDLSATGVTPNYVFSGNSATPVVTVFNNGSTTQDAFDVDVVINDGTSDVYTSSKSVAAAGLVGLTSMDVTMDDEWTTPADGNFTITASVTLPGDVDTGNDEIAIGCFVGTFFDTQAGNSQDFNYGSIDLADGTYVINGALTTDPFPMAEEFDGTNIYRVYNDSTYGTVNAIGEYTAVGTFSGVAGTPSSIAYDHVNSMMYVCMLDGSNLPQLCTADMGTGVLTLVGTGTEGMIIGMDFAHDGYIYGVDLGDNLYQIDPATGAVTIVGPIGIDINYGQDVSYDEEAELLYTISCGSVYELGYYDLTTGAFTSVADMDGDQYATFVITKIADLTSAEILEYSVPNQIGDAVIDDVANTVTLTVGNGTDISALIATFELSYSATAEIAATLQESGVTPNTFTFDVAMTYTITAGDAMTTEDWDITISEAIVQLETDIIAYSIPEQTGDAVIDDMAHTVALEVAYGTDLSALIATFELSFGATATVATVDQESGVTTNIFVFDTPLTYTVLAEDGLTSEDWAVTISEEFMAPGEICATAVDYGMLNDPSQTGTTIADEIFWYSVTLAVDATDVVFALCGSAYDTKMEVWEACDDATFLEENDDECDLQSQITFATLAAGTYYVKIFGYDSGEFGDYILLISNLTEVENEIANVVSVYPNPSTGLVNITATENSTIKVVDIAGRIIEEFTVNAFEEVNFTQSAGMYVVQVESNGDISTHKLIIQ